MLNEILGIEMEVHKKTQSEREGQEIYIKIAKLKWGRIRRKQGSYKRRVRRWASQKPRVDIFVH